MSLARLLPVFWTDRPEARSSSGLREQGSFLGSKFAKIRFGAFISGSNKEFLAMKQLLLVIGVLFLFSACSSAGRDWEAQGGRFVHHKDAVIERSELVVEVRAENGSRSSLSALCYPFFRQGQTPGK